MSKIWIPGSGGGADLDVITAQAGDILAGKVIVDQDGEPLTGTMPNNGAVSKVLPINGSYTIPVGYHNGSGKVTQSIPTRWAATIIPSTVNQTAISAGYYASGNVIVAGDPNLQAGNIKKGARIFGVTGTFEGFVTSPLYVYNNGTFSNVQTGGVTLNYTSNSTYSSFVDSSGSILISCGSTRINTQVDVVGRLISSINLSLYTRLTIIGYSDPMDGILWLGVSNNSSLTNPSQFTVSSSTSSPVTSLSLDISNLSGMHYIYFAARSNIRKAMAYYTQQIYLSNS